MTYCSLILVAYFQRFWIFYSELNIRKVEKKRDNSQFNVFNVTDRGLEKVMVIIIFILFFLQKKT